MSPKRYYSFMIEPEMAAALKRVKEREGVAESEQIRRGIKMWLESKGEKSDRSHASTRKRS
jgi:hypothetical protein